MDICTITTVFTARMWWGGREFEVHHIRVHVEEIPIFILLTEVEHANVVVSKIINQSITKASIINECPTRDLNPGHFVDFRTIVKIAQISFFINIYILLSIIVHKSLTPFQYFTSYLLVFQNLVSKEMETNG